MGVTAEQQLLIGNCLYRLSGIIRDVITTFKDSKRKVNFNTTNAKW